MMLHRKVIPYRPDEAQAGQLREIHAVSLVVWVIGAHIDTGFFYIERFKFQIFMPKNVPKRRTLTAVDSVIIGVDGAKGVETQTRKLMRSAMYMK